MTTSETTPGDSDESNSQPRIQSPRHEFSVDPQVLILLTCLVRMTSFVTYNLGRSSLEALPELDKNHARTTSLVVKMIKDSIMWWRAGYIVYTTNSRLFQGCESRDHWDHRSGLWYFCGERARSLTMYYITYQRRCAPAGRWILGIYENWNAPDMKMNNIKRTRYIHPIPRWSSILYEDIHVYYFCCRKCTAWFFLFAFFIFESYIDSHCKCSIYHLNVGHPRVYVGRKSGKSWQNV